MYRKRGRKLLKPNKEEFETLYYNINVSVYEMAELYNVNIKTIYNWAAQFRKEEKNEQKHRTTLRSSSENSPKSKQIRYESFN